MSGLLSKYLSKLFIQQWVIGIARGNIQEIIKSRTFNPDIKWMKIKSADEFYADPFLNKTKEGDYNIIFEEYSYKDAYGKISVMKLDRDLNNGARQLLLDTQSHLSYPFIFSEGEKTYLFPEAGQSGKLSCYEYDSENCSLKFLKNIISLPLIDSTIVSYKGKYWLLATIRGKDADNKLYIFYADNLTGPYTAHAKNPVKAGLTGTRPAGNMIEVDGELYRPAQNCRYTYGESITINKITELSETDFKEERHMTVKINRYNKLNRGIHGIHTINSLDNIIVVDGTRWRFSIVTKLRQIALRRNKKPVTPGN
jgi:hypothetical protein